LAESLNQNVLVKIHKNKQETIRIQMRRMKIFKQFMSVEEFTALSRQMISTHMKKVEVVPIMRELAQKYSSLGDHDKAVSYIERSDKLACDLLPSMQHEEILHNLVARVEILSKLK